MYETTIAFKDLGKFEIVDLVVHDVNEERLETALIPDCWLYTFGDKLYCDYPTLKDIKSRNWEKPVKDRQYPCPNWTSWPAVHRRDFDDYTTGREYVKTASKKTDIESAHESERGKGKRSRRLPARYSPDYVNSSEDSNEELTTQIQLLYDLPKPPPTVGGQLVKYSADQSQPCSTKQPQTIGSQAFRDISFSTSTPNIDDVASQNLNIGEAATTSNDSRFVRCNLGDKDSQLLMDDDNSETSASETTQTADGEISNPQFGVSVVYPTQSGESAVHPTQSRMSAVYPTQSGASAVYPSQSGVSGVYPTQSGSSAAYPPAKKFPYGADSQTQLGRCSTLSPQPGDEVLSYAGKCIALVKFVKSIGGANGRDAIKRQWPFLLELLIYKRKGCFKWKS